MRAAAVRTLVTSLKKRKRACSGVAASAPGTLPPPRRGETVGWRRSVSRIRRRDVAPTQAPRICVHGQ
jgi:hypothetical protein